MDRFQILKGLPPTPKKVFVSPSDSMAEEFKKLKDTFACSTCRFRNGGLGDVDVCLLCKDNSKLVSVGPWPSYDPLAG